MYGKNKFIQEIAKRKKEMCELIGFKQCLQWRFNIKVSLIRCIRR